MSDIRHTLTPFATVKSRNERKPKAVKITKNRDIHITEGQQQIYNDGVMSVSVDIWGYSDSANLGSAVTPGPTIEVAENTKFNIEWFNRLPASTQMPVNVAVSNGLDNPYLHNVVGDLASDAMGAGDHAQGYAVTHFHGGKTPQLYDGWPEEMMRPQEVGADPQSHLCRYFSDQRPGLYWYHDHAMHTTRLNAYAGLAGCWVIRGQAETDIGLWDADGGQAFGKNDELILVLQDRNVSGSFASTDADAAFTPTGKLLHRAESGYDMHGNSVAREKKQQELDDIDAGTIEDPGEPLEFFGPLNVVNGTLWPTFEKLDAGLYRVRLLNGSNARVYRLHLLKADPANNGYTDASDLIWQIGTDGGLLPEAVQLPNNCLTLAPAERADLLIDFSQHPNSEFILVNSAEAPFSGLDFNDPNPAQTVADALAIAEARVIRPDGALPVSNPDNVDDRNPFPEVLKFKIGAVSANHPNSCTLETIKNNMIEITRPAFEAAKSEIVNNPSQGPTRTVLLAEKATSDERNMLVHMEVATDDSIHNMDPVPPLSANHLLSVNGTPSRIVAERFQDPVSIIATYGSTETWRFINLSGDTHPMHIHLVQFLVVRRVPVNAVVNTVSTPSAVNPGAFVDNDVVQSIDWNDAHAKGPDPNEAGFKDTVRVNPGEMVEVKMRFDGYCGRYLYHCHILEHEDHDMMRQFVVTRNDHVGHGHMWPIGVGK